MDKQRKKELLQTWQDRQPEMGVIALSCQATGECFLALSKDTRADFNSIRFQLSANSHPNRELQNLWNVHGDEQFAFSVVKTLKYDRRDDDHSEALAELLAQCLQERPEAKLIRRQ